MGPMLEEEPLSDVGAWMGGAGGGEGANGATACAETVAVKPASAAIAAATWPFAMDACTKLAAFADPCHEKSSALC